MELDGDAGLADRLGEGAHVAVVAIAAAVEHGFRDAGGLGALGEQLAGALGALGFATRSRSSGSYQLTAASVRPETSSISWAQRPRLERNTEIRGRVAVPETFARTLRRRLSRRSPFVMTLMRASSQ